MVFQWYLFVLLVAVAWFASIAGQTYTVEIHGRTEKRYGWVPVLIIIIPMIVAAAMRSPTIGDTSAYIGFFRNTTASLSAIPEVLAREGKDKGFSIFNILIKMIIGDHYQVYFGIIAAICLFCVAYVYRRYSCNFVMSMFLFLASSDYLQWTHNGMRQFVAVCIVFAATKLLLKKKYWLYIPIVLVASTIHATALLMIPVCFIVQGKAWNVRSVLFTIATLVAINFSGALSDLIVDFMSDSQYSNEVGQFLETEGTNILRVVVFAIPPILALVFKKYVDAARHPVLDLSVNMSIISMGAYIISAVTSGIFIGRIPIYFSLYNYILLPWLVENAFDKRSQKLVYGVIVVCYMVFYCYQTSTVWGL